MPFTIVRFVKQLNTTKIKIFIIHYLALGHGKHIKNDLDYTIKKRGVVIVVLTVIIVLCLLLIKN